MTVNTAIADLPWVPVVDCDGTPREETLPNVLDDADQIAGIAAEDAITDGAIMRLLLGCWTAAHTAGRPPGQWARAWLDGVTVTGGPRPFLQCPPLADAADWDAAGKPVTVLDPFAAGDGPTLLDDRHHASGWEPDRARLTRMLVARQVFDVGGLHPYPRGTRFGKPVGYAAATPGMVRPLLIVEAATLAQTLTASLVPDVPGAPAPHPSWPARVDPGTVAPAESVAQGLIWPARAVLFDGPGKRVMFAGGVTDDRDPASTCEVYPHAVYRTDSKGAREAARASNDQYRAVTTLATAWSDPDPVGVIAHLHQHTDPSERDGWVLRWTGMAAFQSRIDGAMDARLPVPTVTVDEFTAAVDAIEQARTDAVKRIYRASSSDILRERLMSHFTTAASPSLTRAVQAAATDPDRAVTIARHATETALTRLSGATIHLRDMTTATRLEPTR